MPTTLILILIGLLFLLITLVFIYVWIGRTRNPVSNGARTVHTFESLSAIIKNRSSGAQELHHAVEYMLRDFASITPLTLKTYQDLIETLCLHPRTDSKLILRFEKGLRTLNPKYVEEIEYALRLGLAARDKKQF